MIAKIALDKKAFSRNFTYTDSARNAWSEIIENYKINNPVGKVILPAYIGWSANEGSGIFDSVLKADIGFEFYELDENLKIDLADFKSKIDQEETPLVLLVHYFGLLDPNYSKIVNWLDKNRVFFVEDCAHAWLTDLIGGKCGRRGKFSFYSLHKLIPTGVGGIKVENKPLNIIGEIQPFFSLGFDLYSIYETRRANYIYLAKLLKKVDGLDLLYSKLEDGICPQTLPVIIQNFNRDELYNKMNEAGFGMVSLYHTMIKELQGSRYKSASILAKKVINFPIHQDVTMIEMDNMFHKLKEILNG